MSIFEKKNKPELGGINQNNSCEEVDGGCKPEKQESNSLESLINIAEEETIDVVRLFKAKFFDEDKGETSLTSDALEEKIRNAIDIIRDTKIKSLEKDKDSEKENSLQIILSIFRHDIINKLSVLVSATQLLEMDDYEDREFVLKDSQEKIKGMEMLIKEVDEIIEAIMSGEIVLHNVQQVAEDIKNTYSDLKIKINHGHDKCLVKTNTSLCSIFDNIVANAIRHGQATEIDLTVKKEDEKYVVIEIENNGKKLQEGNEEKIFEKGFSGKDTGNTGIGLAMVRDSIEKDHGEVRAENTEKGVKFTIKLPLLEKE